MLEMFYPNNNKKYEKDRSVCKNCYNKNKLNLMKKRFSLLEENSSSKQDSSSNQDISDIKDRSIQEDTSNKQVRSRKQNTSCKQNISHKQVRSRKQDTSSKQDSSINLKNIDPHCLMEKFSELYNIKNDSDEKAPAARKHAKEILYEILSVKTITKRQYNTLYKKCEQ